MTREQLHPASEPAPSVEADGGSSSAIAPSWRKPAEPARPRRPTRARLQTFFLRQFARTGSQCDAAARTGITSRTVRYWRASNPSFAARYDEARAGRHELVEDKAMSRAMGVEHRPVFHRGVPVASVERHNDAMLMRVLARFDRLREREAERLGVDLPGDLKNLSDIEILKAGGWVIHPPRDPARQHEFKQHLDKEVDKWLSTFPRLKENYENVAAANEPLKSES